MFQPSDSKRSICPDCQPSAAEQQRTRRDVLKSAVALTAGTAAAALLPMSLAAQHARAAEAAAVTVPETLVAQLYKSLTDEQKKIIAFPFEHPLRSKVDNNWMITKPAIGKLLTADQQDLVKQIFMDLHDPEYAQRVYDQVEHDNKDGAGHLGFKGCAIALFGEPGAIGVPARRDRESNARNTATNYVAVAPGATTQTGSKSKFEFVFTGRHVTRRCDGNSVEGEAFGGPIFYGHAAEGFVEKPNHPGNVYWYQALQANEVYKALDGKQRKIALLGDGREEQGTKTVALRGKADGLPGIGMTDLTRDQKDLVRKVMADILAPFRKSDATAALKLIEDGGFDNLHMAFYKNMDVGNDGVWDVWQIEGPSMVWYFRGDPHVHTWVHIREPQKV